MTAETVPLLMEPEQLEARLDTPGLRIVDLSRAEVHQRYHIPGAVFVDYKQIVRMQPPAGGLLPDAGRLSALFSAIGLTPETHVVAYDDEGGGKACRLLWTLEAIGHRRYSLLNGGLHAWANEGHPLTDAPAAVTPGAYHADLTDSCAAVADYDFVLSHLHDPAVALLDARSPLEYRGLQRYSARGGHIPGAVNMEWTEALDQERNLRLKPAADLRSRLEQLGITTEQTVVAYCQTHHRSAHTWFVLKWLGYHARGYAGSWSEWGNRADAPVET